jgi:predicted exporter
MLRNLKLGEDFHNDLLNTKSHVVTLIEAVHFFQHQQETATLVTIGSQPFHDRASAVD